MFGFQNVILVAAFVDLFRSSMVGYPVPVHNELDSDKLRLVQRGK